MNRSLSLEIVLNLAAREAMAGDFAEIGPEHLFMGLLRLPEVDLSSLKNAFSGEPKVEDLEGEIQEVLAFLGERGLDFTSLRREIRKAMGRGKTVFKGGAIHRSPESRRLFALAEARCREVHGALVTAPHLLWAIIEHPSALLAKFLGDPGEVRGPRGRVRAGLEGGEKGPQTHDLTSLAKAGEIEPVQSRTVQARALMRHVLHAHRKPVLLGAENETVVRECVRTMVHLLISEGESTESHGYRRGTGVEEVSFHELLPGDGFAYGDYLRTLLHEARDRGTDCLVLSNLHVFDTNGQGQNILSILSAAMARAPNGPCVMLLGPFSGEMKSPDEDGERPKACHEVFLYNQPNGAVAEPFIEQAGKGRVLWNDPFFTAAIRHSDQRLFLSRHGRDQAVEANIPALLGAGLEIHQLGHALCRFLGLSRKALENGLNPADCSRDDSANPVSAHAGGGVRSVLSRALELSQEVPDNEEPGRVSLWHLGASLALSPEVWDTLHAPPAFRDDVLQTLEAYFVRKLTTIGMGELEHRLRSLRADLGAKLFGQDHAIDAFVEGLFNAEVVADADAERRGPKAVFVFAGPPGVGKTYLAECGATALGLPFQRFDMSGYSDPQISVHLLAGAQRSYQAAKQGQLTEFVERNPNGLLLFDEMEKAHLNVVQLFLQILDQGTLQDNFTEKSVSFRDTTIIFTTNAGKKLYENPNAFGIHPVNGEFHRRTVLDALENEKDPRTGKPFFPQAICSRMATGYPLLFNPLGIKELEKIAEAEMRRVSRLVENQYFKEVAFGPLVPLCIVLREGIRADARTVRSQAENLIKAELFRLSRLYRTDRFESIMEKVRRIVFDLDPLNQIPQEVRTLLEPDHKPRVLLLADKGLSKLWTRHVSGVAWTMASEPEALDILETEQVDLVLLDLWLGGGLLQGGTFPGSSTEFRFDHVPAAASGIRQGQFLLRKIHERHPEVPCFLLSFGRGVTGRGAVDEALFLACVRSGGARGMVETAFLSDQEPGWEKERDRLLETILAATGGIYREKKAQEIGAQQKALAFETAPKVDGQTIFIRLRNLGLTGAMAADDVSEILQGVERPSTRFEDVYGADSAKDELRFIVKWLRDPSQYKAMGLRPPRGVLLYGHPGTGKTMLARALAGESNATFIVEAATNFVRKYVGTGPENVRNLFARARRYAPTILFIDEIDAVGKKRSEESVNRAYDETLNALLMEMDGFKSPDARPVIVLAATNLVDTLDGALRRRFDREIEVEKPDRLARTGYLKRRLQGTGNRNVSDEVIRLVAGQSANMTIAELERIIELAGRMASNLDGRITDALVEEAFERMRMGDVKGQWDQETLLRVARHEAGHCIVGWLCGDRPVQISIVARGKAGGYVENEAAEDRMIYTKAALENMIRQAMAGRAGELVCYGQEMGLSTGVTDDLRKATHYAELMVRECGMGEGVGQVALDRRRLADGPMSIRVMKSVERIVRVQLERAVRELEQHRTYLDRLVDALMDRNRLTRKELEPLLAGLA